MAGLAGLAGLAGFAGFAGFAGCGVVCGVDAGCYWGAFGPDGEVGA